MENKNTSNGIKPKKKKGISGFGWFVIVILFCVVVSLPSMLDGIDKAGVKLDQQEQEQKIEQKKREEELHKQQTEQYKKEQEEKQKQAELDKANEYKLEIKSTGVKNVDGKYRYFFSVKNNDTRPFQGEVIINVFNQKGQEIGTPEGFGLAEAIPPNGFDNIFFDRSTGPVVVHGENGIAKFEYVLVLDGKTVGKGTINF